MNKILLLVCIAFTSIALVNAKTTQKPAPVKPVAAAPKSLPYVLKKDYEPQISEMNAKINGALNSTAASTNNKRSAHVSAVTENRQ